jgi:HSP20 family protein
VAAERRRVSRPRGIAVIAELPGVEEADLKVVVESGRLRIGSRRPISAGPNAEALQVEIDCGPFERVVTLPPGADADRIAAQFHAGLLTVHVPIREVSRNVHVAPTNPRIEPRR